MPNQLHNPPKLYLNEHLSPRLAVQLRRYGFDAVSSQEAGKLSNDDEAQFGWAVSEQRAIVTFNFADFVELHERYIEEGREHFGIILSTAETVSVLLHRLLRLLNSVSANEMKNQIRWLNEFK
jgi:predicted nuclease of predicted toxin-antitoxin system